MLTCMTLAPAVDRDAGQQQLRVPHAVQCLGWFRPVTTGALQESGLEGESSGSAASQDAKPKTGPSQVCAVLSLSALPTLFRASTPRCI